MTEENIIVKAPPKKRGRKPKNRNPNGQPNEEPNEEPTIKIPKKRGRKPKGGKIITNIIEKNITPAREMNIILHLKCNSSDINEKKNLFQI